MPYDSISELPANVRKLPESKQRQWLAVWNSSYKACIDDEFGTKDKCESEAFRKANGVVKASEPEDHQAHHEGGWGIQLEKADPRVSYREASFEAEQTCANCRFYDAECMKCDVVEGTIDPAWVCSLWTSQLSVAPISVPQAVDYYYTEPLFSVFVETPSSAFADVDLSKPTWIPFLPKPGRFHHPTYGEINVTPEQNQEMVASVKDHVYQEHIPLDAEHETKLSGAVAWIKDMRLNPDGSADAYVEWTDRGRSLVEGGQFKYVSPEWFSVWRDPATGTVHRNIVAGGAITTRPFFKDRVLRALVASEGGTKIIKEERFEEMHTCKNCGQKFTGDKCPECGAKYMSDPKNPEPAAPQPTTMTLTEAQLDERIQAAIKASEEAAEKKFTEQITELSTKLTAAEAVAASEKAAREATDAKLAEREKADRTRRFSEMVSGQGGSNDGAPWVGDAEKNVAILEALAASQGEDSDIFKDFVAQQSAAAAQIKESQLFAEIGTGGRPAGPSDPERKLQEMTKARMASDPKLSEVQAYSEVLETDEGKKLYEQTQR